MNQATLKIFEIAILFCAPGILLVFFGHMLPEWAWLFLFAAAYLLLVLVLLSLERKNVK